MGRHNPAGGGYSDWISNLTETNEQDFEICMECGNYLQNTVYWDICGEILCDDCAKAKYQRGQMIRYTEGKY